MINLIEGDLPDYRREAGDDAWVRFVPARDGPILAVASHVEKRFLGRTEIAVFRADIGGSIPERSIIALKHTGGLKRTGLAAVAREGEQSAERLAAALAADGSLTEAVMPLDFTRFEVVCEPTGCHVEAELMGASHVAVALPPIRSYVHLYPDQLRALERAVVEVRRVVSESA